MPAASAARVVAILPARFASSRLPGKPLLRESGKYLIQHVVERVRLARSIQRIIVATDDDRIFEAVRSFGGEAAMTSPAHPSGTDRIAEVVQSLEREPGAIPPEIVLNVQGDEPEIEPESLDRLVAALASHPNCPAATLACPFPKNVDPADPNCVKVVKNRLGLALYFSRALIPYPRADVDASDRSGWLLHLGVYAYRRPFLLEFASWPPSPLERTERLEQLRILEGGHAIAVEVVEKANAGIDTPDDYDQFVRRVVTGNRKLETGNS